MLTSPTPDVRKNSQKNQSLLTISKMVKVSLAGPLLLNPAVTAKYPVSCLLQLDTSNFTPNSPTYAMMAIQTFVSKCLSKAWVSSQMNQNC